MCPTASAFPRHLVGEATRRGRALRSDRTLFMRLAVEPHFGLECCPPFHVRKIPRRQAITLIGLEFLPGCPKPTQGDNFYHAGLDTGGIPRRGHPRSRGLASRFDRGDDDVTRDHCLVRRGGHQGAIVSASKAQSTVAQVFQSGMRCEHQFRWEGFCRIPVRSRERAVDFPSSPGQLDTGCRAVLRCQ